MVGLLSCLSAQEFCELFEKGKPEPGGAASAFRCAVLQEWGYMRLAVRTASRLQAPVACRAAAPCPAPALQRSKFGFLADAQVVYLLHSPEPNMLMVSKAFECTATDPSMRLMLLCEYAEPAG
jgi:hypothetical protein